MNIANKIKLIILGIIGLIILVLLLILIGDSNGVYKKYNQLQSQTNTNIAGQAKLQFVASYIRQTGDYSIVSALGISPTEYINFLGSNGDSAEAQRLATGTVPSGSLEELQSGEAAEYYKKSAEIKDGYFYEKQGSANDYLKQTCLIQNGSNPSCFMYAMSAIASYAKGEPFTLVQTYNAVCDDDHKVTWVDELQIFMQNQEPLTKVRGDVSRPTTILNAAGFPNANTSELSKKTSLEDIAKALYDGTYKAVCYRYVHGSDSKEGHWVALLPGGSSSSVTVICDNGDKVKTITSYSGLSKWKYTDYVYAITW